MKLWSDRVIPIGDPISMFYRIIKTSTNEHNQPVRPDLQAQFMHQETMIPAYFKILQFMQNVTTWHSNMD